MVKNLLTTLMITSILILGYGCNDKHQPKKDTSKGQTQIKVSVPSKTAQSSKEDGTTVTTEATKSKTNEGEAADDDKDKQSGTSSEDSSIGTQTDSQKTEEADKATTAVTEYQLQITALNFLAGGVEGCDYKNQVIKFKSDDENQKLLICANSKVELSITSDNGIITFEALDLTTNKIMLANEETSTGTTYELGKTVGMIRYEVNNPYGFTYLMIVDVTKIDAKNLKKLNDLNDHYTKLQAEVLEAQKNDTEVDEEVLKEINDILTEMKKISQGIEEQAKPEAEQEDEE